MNDVTFSSNAVIILFSSVQLKRKKKNIVENSAWGTCAFVQPNKCSNYWQGLEFTVRTFFFFTLYILGNVITITSIVKCQGTQCSKGGVVLFVLALHTMIILTAMRCTYLSLM